MSLVAKLSVTAAALLSLVSSADSLLFQDDFAGKLAEGWYWLREDPAAWRTTGDGLELRVLPGNMWGAKNDARNVLVRELPASNSSGWSVSVTVENHPTAQYEQVNLVCYFDDSHMVKIGLELVDGQLSLVMGREEADKTRTLALLPLSKNSVQLRLDIRGGSLRGMYRFTPTEAWRLAAEGTLPGSTTPKASIQAYQGPSDAEHWAKVRDFSVRSLPDAS